MDASEDCALSGQCGFPQWYAGTIRASRYWRYGSPDRPDHYTPAASWRVSVRALCASPTGPVRHGTQQPGWPWFPQQFWRNTTRRHRFRAAMRSLAPNGAS